MSQEVKSDRKRPKKSLISQRQLTTPDKSIADAIKFLTDNGITLEMLSNISENDVPRLAVMITVGKDEDLEADFLTDLARAELALMCSVVMKKGGIRSEQIKEITKAPPMMMDGGAGFLDRMRSRFRR
jgi:hypothetical protein